MTAQDVISAALLVAGLLFFLLGAVGLARLPDFFSRLHPAGKSDTLGAILVILAVAIHHGWSLVAAKVLLVQLFIFFSNPAGTHAMGRAAYRAGLRPWLGVEEERR